MPCFIRHELCDLGTAQMRLCFVGIDDAFLHLIEQADCLFHIGAVAHRHRRRIVDHQHGSRCDVCFITRHCDDGCSRSRDAVDLDRDLALMVAEHGVDREAAKQSPPGEFTQTVRLPPTFDSSSRKSAGVISSPNHVSSAIGPGKITAPFRRCRSSPSSRIYSSAFPPSL